MLATASIRGVRKEEDDDGMEEEEQSLSTKVGRSVYINPLTTIRQRGGVCRFDGCSRATS